MVWCVAQFHIPTNKAPPAIHLKGRVQQQQELDGGTYCEANFIITAERVTFHNFYGAFTQKSLNNTRRHPFNTLSLTEHAKLDDDKNARGGNVEEDE